MPETGLYRIISAWECLERAQKGDEGAWQELVRRYYPSLLKTTSLITGSMESAKDLVQETFVKMLQTKPKHHQGDVGGYLSTIAYRLALKEKARYQKSRSLDEDELADESASALENVVIEENQKYLIRAIQSLSEEHRDILILRFYGNHSYEKIAELTQLPLGTVKSRIFYAVKSCQEKLRKEGVLE